MNEFRPVAPLTIGDGLWRVFNKRFVMTGVESYPIEIAQARALRDWLTKALPCEHIFFTGSIRADPFGKSDAMIEVKNRCVHCGFQADGGSEHG